MAKLIDILNQIDHVAEHESATLNRKIIANRKMAKILTSIASNFDDTHFAARITRLEYIPVLTITHRQDDDKKITIKEIEELLKPITKWSGSYLCAYNETTLVATVETSDQDFHTYIESRGN